jgi:hypothetical protein
LSLSGRFGPGQDYDSTCWLALLSGTGRGESFDGDNYMGVGRYQWNFLGRELPFSQSDIARRKAAAGSAAVAAVYAKTPFTKFSSSGGGQLPGFEPGVDGQYRLRQILLETAYHYRGFSYQQELHFKEIEDRFNGTTRRLWGGYVQAGYFFHELWPVVPAPLEMAGRIALVDPDTSVDSYYEQEWTLGANWFFKGHRNKITADISRIRLDDPAGVASENRFRLQWDVSF